MQPHAKGRPGVLAAPRLRGQEGSPEALGELPVALDGRGQASAGLSPTSR